MNKQLHVITKSFGSYAMAHRQYRHGGHCQLIHGHNITVELTLCAFQLDGCGFVYDFGEMGFVKFYFTELLDHKFVASNKDPQLPQWKRLHDRGVLHLVVLPHGGSAEEMANQFLEELHSDFMTRTDGRVGLLRVAVFEDEKNIAIAERANIVDVLKG